MNNRERIGRRIAEMRAESGLSTRQLADMCGVNFSNIGKIERGAYNVSIDILSKVSIALGYEIDFKKIVKAAE